MYTLAHCHALYHGEWIPVPYHNVSVKELYTKYGKVRCYVTAEDGSAILFCIPFSETFGDIDPVDYEMTLEDWVATKATPAMTQTHTQYLTLDKVKTMHRRDLWSYPVKAYFGNVQYGEGVVIPMGMDTDIVIEEIPGHGGIISKLGQDHLFSINGRMVESIQVNNRLFLLDGRLHAGSRPHFPVVSVLDFSELGTTTWHRFTPEMLSPIARTPEAIAAQMSYYRLIAPVPLGNRTVLVVINGHPHFMDKTIDVYDTNTAILSLSNAQLCRRAVQDNPAIAYESDGRRYGSSGVILDSFDVGAHLCSTFSGILVIDNPDVYKVMRSMGRTDIRGAYTFPQIPKGIILANDGSMLEYGIEGYDYNQASISVLDNRDHRLMDVHQRRDTPYVISLTEESLPHRYRAARMVDIFTTVLPKTV